MNLRIPAFLPCLQHMAAVNVALLLFNENDIQRFSVNIPNYEIGSRCTRENNCTINEDWSRLKVETSEKMGKILPPELKTLVVEMLRPLYGELQLWKKDHYFFSLYSTKINCSNLISWKSDGTINRIKTAKNFFRNESFSPVVRFFMACIYFQENEIVTLWDKVRYSVPSGKINIVLRFWIRWLRGSRELPWTNLVDKHLGNPYTFQMFSFPLRVSCFFQALSSRNRQNYSAFLGWSTVHYDDLLLCVFQMDEMEKFLFYENNCKNVLVVLLRWPFQTIFMSAANKLWGYLKPDEFYCILKIIVNDYILKDLHYFDFLTLFKDFWHASSGTHKEHVRKINFFPLVKFLLSSNKETPLFSLEEAMEMYPSSTKLHF